MNSLCKGLVIIIAICFVSFIIACALLVLFRSPGKALPLVDARGARIAGSISEKIRVPINGVEQGMIIKGSNPASPVLLFVHGGPGNPSYPLSAKYPTHLEDHFIVCWWDQRGTCLSYSDGISCESMTAGQMVLDTIAVTNYLRARFGQEKIYLMGHSWGTYVAIRAAQRAPGLYRAYIAMSQMVLPMESEKMSCAYLADWARSRGDAKLADKFGRVSFGSSPGLPPDYAAIRDSAMHRAGVGTTHGMKSVLSGFIIPFFMNPEYSLGDKIDWMRGMMLNRSSGLTEVRWTVDVPSEVPSLEIPVYFFSGKYDFTCSVPLVREYFRSIKAPVKGFYLFLNSAHSPVFEEPALANRILTEDVMAGKTGLATER